MPPSWKSGAIPLPTLWATPACNGITVPLPFNLNVRNYLLFRQRTNLCNNLFFNYYFSFRNSCAPNVAQFYVEHVLEMKGAQWHNNHVYGAMGTVCIGGNCPRLPLSSQFWEGSTSYRTLVLQVLHEAVSLTETLPQVSLSRAFLTLWQFNKL